MTQKTTTPVRVIAPKAAAPPALRSASTALAPVHLAPRSDLRKVAALAVRKPPVIHLSPQSLPIALAIGDGGNAPPPAKPATATAMPRRQFSAFAWMVLFAMALFFVMLFVVLWGGNEFVYLAGGMAVGGIVVASGVTLIHQIIHAEFRRDVEEIVRELEADIERMRRELCREP